MQNLDYWWFFDENRRFFSRTNAELSPRICPSIKDDLNIKTRSSFVKKATSFVLTFFYENWRHCPRAAGSGSYRACTIKLDRCDTRHGINIEIGALQLMFWYILFFTPPLSYPRTGGHYIYPPLSYPRTGASNVYIQFLSSNACMSLPEGVQSATVTLMVKVSGPGRQNARAHKAPGRAKCPDIRM